jgi:hypothetical protein
MRLRSFNAAGRATFRQFLQAAREDSSLPAPVKLLEDRTLTTLVEPAIEVEPRSFRLRADAAEYLRDKLEPLNEHWVANDAGVWTWLTLFYFDEVCPLLDGRRSVKNDYSYIFEPKNPRHFYRHRLFIAWRVITSAPNHNRLFLNVNLPTLDHVTAEVFKRLYLVRIPCLFELLDQLYWDDERSRPRVGIVDSDKVNPGDLIHRLPIRIRQLEKTFDLASVSAEQLLKLLGPEFALKDVPTANRT